MSLATAVRIQSRSASAPSSPRNFRFTCRRSDHLFVQCSTNSALTMSRSTSSSRFLREGRASRRKAGAWRGLGGRAGGRGGGGGGGAGGGGGGRGGRTGGGVPSWLGSAWIFFSLASTR